MVSSELLLTSESVPSVRFPENLQSLEGLAVEDEEFPSDLAGDYDRIFQPAAGRLSRRILGFVALIVAFVLIAISGYVLHHASKPPVFLSASPSSASR